MLKASETQGAYLGIYIQKCWPLTSTQLVHTLETQIINNIISMSHSQYTNNLECLL